jgi:hypothetical protein
VNISNACIIWHFFKESQRVQLHKKACYITEEENAPSAESIRQYKANLQKLLQVSLCTGKLVILDHILAYQNLNDLTFNSATLMKLILMKAQA